MLTIDKLHLTFNKYKKKSLVSCQLSVVKPGQIMVIAIVFLAVVLILASSLFTRVAGFLRFGSNSILREQATTLAEAGVEKAVWQLNETIGSYTGETDTALGTTGTFTTTITDKSPTLKTITATGYVPNSSTPRAKRTIKVDILVSSSTVTFRYAVQIGAGGLSMANSSIIHGNVYSNANIVGSGSSTIEGDAYAAGTITTPDPFVTGLKFENQPQTGLPTVDYQFWRDAANINNDEVTCSPTCTISTSGDFGPKRYIGNLHITNNVILTMKGPVHVTGNFTISQGGTTIKLDDSFGSNGTVLIMDGIVSYNQGGSFVPTNAIPKGYILVITSSDANPAAEISQSGATAVFYALEGTAKLSQTADVTSIVAKQLQMSQSAELTFDSGLASAQFTTGPGGSWQIKRGTYKFTSSP